MIPITNAQARELRSLAKRLLQLVPDPDAMVHAREGSGRGLCRREGRHPRLTDEPAEVTCSACRDACEWDPWVFRRDEVPEGETP